MCVPHDNICPESTNMQNPCTRYAVCEQRLMALDFYSTSHAADAAAGYGFGDSAVTIPPRKTHQKPVLYV